MIRPVLAFRLSRTSPWLVIRSLVPLPLLSHVLGHPVGGQRGNSTHYSPSVSRHYSDPIWVLWEFRRPRLAPLDDPVFRSCSTSERDVGSPLISSPDRIGQCLRRRGCLRRFAKPRHSRVRVSVALTAGTAIPIGDWALSKSSLYLTARVLRCLFLSVFS